MKFQLIRVAIIVAFSVARLPAANAQFAKPEDAVKYRQSALFVMGNHFGRINAVVKGDVPFNKEEVIKNATLVNTMASLAWQGFGPGTEGGRALPNIWTEAPKYKSYQDKLQASTAAMLVAAQSGDLENVKKAFAAVGGNCKACHDDFRKK
jgi:cytochrome c556